MTGEREASEPLSPFSDEGTAPQNSIQSGLKITIADILFCMFAVALILMALYQPWGGHEEESQPVHLVSGIVTALISSVFFTANRIRRSRGQTFFAMAPGHYVAMLGAGYLATYIFQYFVSFLDTRHVGNPIHDLSQCSPTIFCTVASSTILLRVKLTPRWLAFFAAIAGYGAVHVLCVLASLNASFSDLADPLHAVSQTLWQISFGLWSLAQVFLLIAYLADLIVGEKRDWLHHSAVLLDLTACIAALIEDQYFSRSLWMIYYWYIGA